MDQLISAACDSDTGSAIDATISWPCLADLAGLLSFNRLVFKWPSHDKYQKQRKNTSEDVIQFRSLKDKCIPQIERCWAILSESDMLEPIINSTKNIKKLQVPIKNKFTFLTNLMQRNQMMGSLECY